MPRSESSLRAFARRYVIAFGISAIVMVGAVVFQNYIGDQIFNSIKKVDVHTKRPLTEITNYLLIGSDTRAFVSDTEEQQSFGGPSGEAAGQRSDTLMVIHIDPHEHRAIVVSFPRDLWVEISGVPLDNTHCARISTGKCMSKINSAFGNGPDVVIQTLKQNFDISINHYVEVDFKTFQGIVDAIGSVPIYFPYPTRDEGTGLYTPVGGCHQLDGKGALAYARSRHIEYYSFSEQGWYKNDATADLARIKRQQDFMRRLASLAVAKSLNDPFTAINVIDQIVTNLKIDDSLTKDDLLALVDIFSKIDPNDAKHVEFLTLPGRNASEQGLSVLIPDAATSAPLLEVLRDTKGNVSTTPTTANTTSTVPSTGSPSTTSTTSPALPVTNLERFGTPAPLTAPCV